MTTSAYPEYENPMYPGMSDAEIMDEVDKGYAEVDHLFALGALCCMDAQATDHTKCVWHDIERRNALLRTCEDPSCAVCKRCGVR